MTPGGADNLHQRLRRALPVAIKARDRPAVAALRSALAAIDNAGAVDPSQAPPGVATPDPTGPGPATPGPTGPGPATPDPTGPRPATPGPTGPGPAAPDPTGPGPPDPDPTGPGPPDPGFAGTVAGVGAAEVERRSLTPAQMEEIVRAEIADREAAAVDYERGGQLEHAERLRGEAQVLAAYLDKA